MKIITRPTLTLIASPQFHEHPTYKIPDDGTPAEKLGAFGAKACYDSFLPKGRSNLDNQREVVEHAHGSVLEHATFSIFVEGVSRGLSHEWVRHRAGWAYSQRSTRYVAEEDGGLVIPPHYVDTWEGMKHWYLGESPSPYPDGVITDPAEAELSGRILSQTAACRAYAAAVERLVARNPLGLKGFALRKWARGLARDILPSGVETRFLATGNLRAWRHFIMLRSAEGAEDEIRQVAGMAYDLISPLAPVYFEEVKTTTIRGLRTFTSSQPKV